MQINGFMMENNVDVKCENLLILAGVANNFSFNDFHKKIKMVNGTGFSKKVLLPIAIFTMEIPIIPIRQRSTELTPKSGGLGYGKIEHHGINLASIPPNPPNRGAFIHGFRCGDSRWSVSPSSPSWLISRTLAETERHRVFPPPNWGD